ncbi:MAG: proprotein convertase P-domain-containing protein, partial [Caldilineaceae bacterium]|nr:proprotein convertase P-domain-containing protein [Caldilineaceae bacterium]
MQNLPYEIDIQIDAPPPPTPTPNNWSCTIYPSSDVPQPIDDLTTLASVVNVGANGTVTHVGLRDITLQHNALYQVSFGLTAPDGTTVDLFDFGGRNGCGSGNCLLSLDDAAIDGLQPPDIPTTGDTYRPNRGSFAPFIGTQSNGQWTFLVSDDGAAGEGGPTIGTLHNWSLEVCIDNGNLPDPTPTPTATPTPIPQPNDGVIPTVTATPVVAATPTPLACTATGDGFEDDTYQTAKRFDIAFGTSSGHTFDTATDADWHQINLVSGLQYTLQANVLDPAQVVLLTLYATDGTTRLDAQAGELTFTPTASGDYYVRTSSGSGLSVSPCNSGYSLVLTSTNPNATPVPTPVGGASLPPDYDAPPLSAAVKLAAGQTITDDNPVLTQLQPVNLEVGLNAENGIQGAELLVNGSSIDTYSAPANTTDGIWPVGWTPSQAGTY